MADKWFKATGVSVLPVLVERASETSVWIDGKRRARLSAWSSFHPTWAEARDHLLNEQEAKVEGLRRQLTYENGRLGNIKGMKEPNA